MQLITNFGPTNNHFSILRTLAAGAEGLTILSPYLSPDLERLLAKLSLDQLQRFRLITTLEPNSPTQLYNTEALDSLRRYFTDVRPDVEWLVDLSEHLHGKVYVFSQEDRPYAAIISSANFTESGLRRNHEWGVAIRDPKMLADLQQTIIELSATRLDNGAIEQLYAASKQYLTEKGGFLPGGIDLNLMQLLQEKDTIQLGNRTFWLKPWGVTDDPVVEGETFGQPETDLHFSKVRPSGVKVGDWMILYGVGARRFLGIFEVIGPPEKATDEEIRITPWKERWPWYVAGQNLCPRFGASWWHHNLYVQELREEYLIQHPNSPITAEGGQTYGALNWGADKVRLDPSFATFIIERIQTIEARLATN